MLIKLNDSNLENVSDTLKNLGYELPDDWDNETVFKLTTAILDALHIEYEDDF